MPSKLTNRVRIAAEYFRRKAVLEGGPLEVSIESTAKCNLYCPMCPRHVYTFDNESMDFELYKKIIEDCKDSVEFVWPYGIGEPMLHPEYLRDDSPDARSRHTYRNVHQCDDARR